MKKRTKSAQNGAETSKPENDAQTMAITRTLSSRSVSHKYLLKNVLNLKCSNVTFFSIELSLSNLPNGQTKRQKKRIETPIIRVYVCACNRTSFSIDCDISFCGNEEWNRNDKLDKSETHYCLQFSSRKNRKNVNAQIFFSYLYVKAPFPSSTTAQLVRTLNQNILLSSIDTSTIWWN